MDMRRFINLTESIDPKLEDHIEDNDVDGQTFHRIVWEKKSSYKTNRLSTVGLPDVDGLFGVHVTSDVEYWFKRIQEDYGRDGDAYVMEVHAVEGDMIAGDNQFQIPGDDGIIPDTHVLVTHRTLLQEGKDFRFVKVLKDDRNERSNDFEQGQERSQKTC